jgi:hypothetical protein
MTANAWPVAFMVCVVIVCLAVMFLAVIEALPWQRRR